MVTNLADTGGSGDAVGTSARWILLAVLGVVSLGLLVPGGLVYLTVVGEWADSSRGFAGIEGAIGWLFGLCATAAIAAGLIIVGVMLRLAHWDRAPLASLFLAVLSVGFIIGTYFVFSDTNTTDNSIEVVFLQGCCIVALLVVALPPFLHWVMTKPQPTITETPKGWE
ncbi:hypothetical protein IHQ71_24940 [Rhizobium sp. TH2]|uniref:hypothetical protein n=1 Tax=Rhizobium sp. TH2 TaxID=2775403 RepID=UPI002157A5AB|nr:hypothetical protein [Rhizobium sp. TH2]UVC08357.1 hypothetical protein IHQ71_24940 [Rhizobium sp. TH2]